MAHYSPDSVPPSIAAWCRDPLNFIEVLRNNRTANCQDSLQTQHQPLSHIHNFSLKSVWQKYREVNDFQNNLSMPRETWLDGSLDKDANPVLYKENWVTQASFPIRVVAPTMHILGRSEAEQN